MAQPKFISLYDRLKDAIRNVSDVMGTKENIMFNGGESGSWFRQNIWNPFINDGVYAYQEWVDEGIASVVPESKENIDISDRAAGALAGLLIVPLSIPATIFSTLGCDFGGETEDVNEWQPEPDTYTPPAECMPKEEIPYNGIDEDCDGYDLLDVDGDGYCKADEWIKNKDYQCPQEKEETGSDCDDTEYLANPEAVEICNDKDNNCDGKIDCALVCVDNDNDGYGENCELGADCDDTNSQIFPGAFELCNNKDDNCNGQKDENYNVGDACEVGIGLCVGSGKYICSPSGLDAVCDAKPLPPKTEIACDGKDQDCDGSDLPGTDKDGDGYKIEGGACGAVDCNDSNPQINSGALELCNNIDDNCGGNIDEGYNTGESCTAGVGACANTGGYVCASNELETVCDVAPLEPQNEIPCDGIDQDCDGSDFLGTDMDGDGYTAEGGLCDVADCDDNNANVHPATLSEAEMGLANDGIDNNCDGFVDEIDVNGGELTLSNASGYHGYIHIYNGGKLKLADSVVSWTTGDLTIDAGSVLDISGVVCGSGNGYSGGGQADGGGGSGASHVQAGGSGGYGGWSGYGFGGGPTYGSATDLSTESGSCGGNGGVSGAPGGMGGGAISISANNAFIYGEIYADGKNGTNAPWDDGGGGGGSGGGILVSASNIYVDTSTTKLTVRGGNGGNGGSFSESGGGGGGGGAGGTIELSFSSAIVQGAIYEIYGSEPCCGFANRLLEYDIAQTDGGLGGSYGSGAKKNGQPGGNGGYGTVKSP